MEEKGKGEKEEKMGFMRATYDVLGDDVERVRNWANSLEVCEKLLVATLLSAVIGGSAGYIASQFGAVNVVDSAFWAPYFGSLAGLIAPTAIFSGCKLASFVGKEIYDGVSKRLKQIEKRANMPLRKLTTPNTPNVKGETKELDK